MLVALIGIYLGRRIAGVLSWGSLVPAYFLLMLLVFPLMNYVGGEYIYYTVVPTEEDAVRLYVLCSLGLVIFISAYLWVEMIVPAVSMQNLSAKYSNFVSSVFSNKLNVLFFIIVASGATLWSIAYGYFGLTNRDSAEVGYGAGAISIVSYLLAYVNIILWSTFWQSSKEERSLALPGLSLTLLLLSAILSNSKGALLFPVLHVLLTYYFARNRVPVIAIFVLVVFFFAFAYPVIQGFRYAVYFDLSDKSPLSSLSVFVDYLFSFAWLSPASTPEGERSLSLGRGLFSYLAYIFKQAGDVVPYLNGSTYFEGLETFVPRLFLPDKVDMSTGHWTGQLFDHVALDDPITNVSPTYMGEFYMNNGILGLVIGMALIGVFSGLIDKLVFKASGNWLKVIFVLNILWLEAFVGTTILVFVKTFLMFIFCVYVLSIFTKLVSVK